MATRTSEFLIAPGPRALLSCATAMEGAGITACIVCREPARVTDWHPITAWLMVEGCACGGFFVWKPLWEQRIPALGDAQREELARRVRYVHERGGEVWLTTRDGRVGGPIVIAPDPTRP